MRILLLSNMYPSAPHPGFGIFVRNQVAVLQKDHAYAVQLLVSREDPRTLPGKIMKYLKLNVGAWKAAFKKFDVVHLHYASTAHILAAVPVLLLRREPVIATLHGGEINTLPTRGSRRFVVRSFLKHADAIICVSGDLKSKLTGGMGLPASRISVIDVGCDVEHFRPCAPSEKEAAKRKVGLTPDSFALLFVGRLVFHKGLDVLFRALSLMDDRADLQLLIVGTGPEREELEAEALRRGIADRISWIGEKPHDELPGFYAACDAFVLPSRREGTPTVILEAMASGCPIIATRVGGIPEVINNGVNGLLFDSEDHDQLLGCIDQLRRDPVKREQLAKQAVIDARDHALDRQIGRITALYQSILERKSP